MVVFTSVAGAEPDLCSDRQRRCLQEGELHIRVTTGSKPSPTDGRPGGTVVAYTVVTTGPKPSSTDCRPGGTFIA